MPDKPTDKKIKVKIIFDRNNCIGAAVCAVIDPKHWKMVDDGKAILEGAKELKPGKYELVTELTEQEYKTLVDSAQSCPVQVIQIEELTQ